MQNKSIINTDNVSDAKKPMFFGGDLGIQRYDKPKYEKIFNMFKQQIAYLWRPEEINLSKDKGDFNNMSDHSKWVFTMNLKYQIFLDTINSRGISHLLKYCSNTEVEAFCKIWEYIETLHSYSYTYVIKQVYTNPSDVFDNILNDKQILKRASSVTKYYDAMINEIEEKESLETDEKKIEYLRKKALYLTLVSINILEGIRFYVSFACSFAFAENKLMEGNAKIISLIARDENLHMGFTSLVLKMLQEDPTEGFQEVIEDCKDIVINMYKDAAEEEIEWAKYLFEEGSIIGLNSDILIQYMKFLTNNRLKMIRMEPIFEKTANPISWIGNWTGANLVQDAPQETEIIAYVNAVKQDVDEQNYEEFDF